HRGILVGVLLGAVQGRGRLRHPHPRAHLPPDRPARQAGRGKGLMTSAAGAPAFDLRGALKDAFIAGAIVVLLTIALVGVRTQEGGVAYRFDDVLAAAVLAFLGRLAFLALRARRALPVLNGAAAFA